MSNIINYIDWRGDLDFSSSEFNEVDNLLFAELAYVKFEEIVPGVDSDESITIAEVSEKFFKKYSLNEIKKNKSLIRKAPFVMEKMAKSKRYKDLKLSKYINVIDEKEQKQFSAIHIDLGNNTKYIAFRGTDDNLVGWKEDFNMSFIMPVPSQIEAVIYLNNTLKDDKSKVIIGGHSKGGNLAVFSSMYCNDYIKERIISIYNNDGPGFKNEILGTEEYNSIQNRITTIMPESSIIGMLLNHEEDYVIVKSNEIGIMQHDALSWLVLGPKFLHVKDISKASKKIDSTLKNWLNTLSEEELSEFVDTLYLVIKATGAKKVSDLTTFKMKNLKEILKSIKLIDSKTRESILAIMKKLIKV